jgi:hypothetical protein
MVKVFGMAKEKGYFWINLSAGSNHHHDMLFIGSDNKDS